ncbi:MAG: hypothetical protein OXC99_09985 [Chloroflexi bacterium]|nr:hypothetical protein [Chloroflexota bacterium]
MTEQSRPSFELLLGEVSLKAPETPLYLRLASQVLEARRLELEDGLSPEPEPAPPAPSPSPTTLATLEPPSAEAPAVEAVTAADTLAEAADLAEPQGPAEIEIAPAPASEPAAAFVEETPALGEISEPEAALVESMTVEERQPPEMPPLIPSPEPFPAADAPARRARWFRGQLPVVNFEDGSSRVMDSLDALKDLLRSRGLTPHPRGDASMLLWQVRNRLGLSVDQVDA